MEEEEENGIDCLVSLPGFQIDFGTGPERHSPMAQRDGYPGEDEDGEEGNAAGYTVDQNTNQLSHLSQIREVRDALRSKQPACL